jgi:predicted ATPase/class 3 adenylate cyclase
VSEATFTFLFTDIEGSTRLWEVYPAAMRAALARHDDLLREAIEGHGGRVFKTIGDQFCAVFDTPPEAVAAALAAQRALQQTTWTEVGGLRVRMMLHTGVAEVRDGDYYGQTLNRIARLLPAGHGGQVLLSQATAELVRDHLPGDVTLEDRGEHRLPDMGRPERIFQLVAPGLQDGFGPLRLPSARLHGLPVQLSSFVGREHELDEVKQWLTRTRLLTLLGAGGCGKTRLALQAASELQDRYLGGVWFVDLTALADATLVQPTVAAALGVRAEPGRPLLEPIAECLRPEPTLLVLDNCEHLVPACAQLAHALLQGATGLRILATSRELLGVTGETVYPVASLSAPDERSPHSPEALSHYEAVRLFLERAADVSPSFSLTQANAGAVAEVCRQLEGIPLAIELAAARLKVLSVEQIAARLSNRFQLLTGGSRTAAPRHQTLRAALDWGYDLLSEPERALLRQLSVFVGGFWLEAVEAVCGEEVLDLLSALAEKSLVLVEEQAGAARYRMLETIRQYARERLAEDGGAARSTAERHARYYLKSSRACAARVRTPDEAAAMERWVRELDNLRAAMDWAHWSDESALSGHLAQALYLPLQRRGSWEEARWRLQAGRAAAAELGSDGERLLAAISRDLASLAEDMGDLDEAREQAEASLAISERLGDREGVADALNLLGRVAVHAGDLDAARGRFEAALEQIPAADDHARRGVVMHNLANLLFRRGDGDSARRLYQESLAHLRAAGALHDEAGLLGDMGALAQEHDGDLPEARRLYRESLALYRAVGEPYGIAVMLNNLGEIAEAEGDLETAVRLLVHAERILRELRSIYATEPAASLKRLAEQTGPERWAVLRAEAERMPWEDVVA